METWENYPVVYLTPDSDQWDPHAASFADAEAAMLDSNREIVTTTKRNRDLFEEGYISVLYAKPGTWESFEQLVDDQACGDDNLSYPFLEDNEATLSCDGICVQLASLTTVYEPSIFSAVLYDQAFISRVSMAVGSMTVDDAACEVFEARVVQLSAISAAGRSKGVTPEVLSKIWSIPFYNAARTLSVTTQLIQQDPNSLLSQNAIGLFVMDGLMGSSSPTRCLLLQKRRVCVGIHVSKSLSRTRIIQQSTQ